MKKISLTGKYGKDKYALIDDDDFGLVSKFKWHLSLNGYPMYMKHETGKNHSTRSAQSIFLHHVVLGSRKKGFVVDHVNLNRLDNRKTNLRVATHSQNHQNRLVQSNNKAGIKGVRQRGNRWSSRITKHGNEQHLGFFSSKEEAAESYNKAAKELFGEFALLNKI